MRVRTTSLCRACVALLMLASAGGVLADDEKSVAQLLIDADAKLALQKINRDLDKGAGPAPVSAAPAGVPAAKVRDRAPQTIALYGVDGRQAGGSMNLRSYVKWGDQVYPARVGAKWRGFTVSDISEAGTTFSRGKAKVFAPLVQEDAAVLLEPPRGAVAGGAQATPAGPLPAQAGGFAPGPFPPPLPTMAPTLPMAPPMAPPMAAPVQPIAQR